MKGLYKKTRHRRSSQNPQPQTRTKSGAPGEGGEKLTLPPLSKFLETPRTPGLLVSSTKIDFSCFFTDKKSPENNLVCFYFEISWDEMCAFVLKTRECVVSPIEHLNVRSGITRPGRLAVKFSPSAAGAGEELRSEEMSCLPSDPG